MALIIIYFECEILENSLYNINIKKIIVRHEKHFLMNTSWFLFCPQDGFSVGLVDDDSVYEWQVMIEGPEDTMYEGGLFPAILSFPPDYPNKPPTMRFTTKDFLHPNGQTELIIFLCYIDD